MLTEEQIREALRPLVKQETTLDMLLAIGMEEYRAIEQAVRKEMEGDAKDAERYRFLRDNTGCTWHIGAWDDTPFGDFNIACGEPAEIDAAIDAARGQT